jgi:hypothetical protein
MFVSDYVLKKMASHLPSTKLTDFVYRAAGILQSQKVRGSAFEFEFISLCASTNLLKLHYEVPVTNKRKKGVESVALKLQKKSKKTHSRKQATFESEVEEREQPFDEIIDKKLCAPVLGDINKADHIDGLAIFNGFWIQPPEYQGAFDMSRVERVGNSHNYWMRCYQATVAQKHRVVGRCIVKLKNKSLKS